MRRRARALPPQKSLTPTEFAQWLLAEDKRLQKRYGPGYLAGTLPRLWAIQEGRCGICGRNDERLHLDHMDYPDRMEVRGLLCPSCNRFVTRTVTIEHVETTLRFLKRSPFSRYIHAEKCWQIRAEDMLAMGITASNVTPMDVAPREPRRRRGRPPGFRPRPERPPGAPRLGRPPKLRLPPPVSPPPPRPPFGTSEKMMQDLYESAPWFFQGLGKAEE